MSLGEILWVKNQEVESFSAIVVVFILAWNQKESISLFIYMYGIIKKQKLCTG